MDRLAPFGVCLDGDWKFVVSSISAETSWFHRKVMINRRTFPIDNTSPYAVKRMAEHLQAGGRLVLFAEGRLSRTGTLMKLFQGTGFLLHKTEAKVITCELRNANRLPYSPNPGLKLLFPTVTAHLCEVLTPPKCDNHSKDQARTTLTSWLRDKMVDEQFKVEMEFGPRDVLSAIVESARERPKQRILEDASRAPITYRRLLVGADVLSQPLNAALARDASRVAVLLPNVNAVPVLIMSLWHIGKVPAVLNYSSGAATMLACCQLAAVKQIVTSRAFLERAKLEAEPITDAGIQLLYLEDLRARITVLQKFISSLRMRFSPSSLRLGPATSRPSSTAVILFTSGSEGMPKAWNFRTRISSPTSAR